MVKIVAIFFNLKIYKKVKKNLECLLQNYLHLLTSHEIKIFLEFFKPKKRKKIIELCVQ